MIFCKNCGRYSADGTQSCGACHADLTTHGHVSFQTTTVKAAAVSPRSFITPAPAPTPARAPKPVPAGAVAVAELEPEPEMDVPSPDSETDPLFDRDKFLLRQKALAIKEKYYVTDDAGSNLMFVERPALLTQQLIMLAAVAATFFGGTFVMTFITGLIGGALGGGFRIFSLIGTLVVLGATGFVFFLLVPRRHVTFYKDDSKTEKILEILQLNKVEFPYANFSILDAAGNLIGSFRKNVLFDYVRRRWQVMNANGLNLCTAKEDSIILSLLRRTGIPIFQLMRTNFIFLRGEEVIGEFNRKFTLLDRYVLDLTADPQRTFDRRLAVALGVMLDTGERR
jgi:uncharacterized protein YxjI